MLGLIPRRLAQVIEPTVVWRLAHDRPAVAMTFDDGPSQWTNDILDVLAHHSAKATFFILGSSIRGRERELQRAVADGHELGNHLFSHQDVRRLHARVIGAELRSTSAIVAAATEAPSPAGPPTLRCCAATGAADRRGARHGAHDHVGRQSA